MAQSEPPPAVGVAVFTASHRLLVLAALADFLEHVVGREARRQGTPFDAAQAASRIVGYLKQTRRVWTGAPPPRRGRQIRDKDATRPKPSKAGRKPGPGW